MSEKFIAALAAQWACSKIGYKYSQLWRSSWGAACSLDIYPCLECLPCNHRLFP